MANPAVELRPADRLGRSGWLGWAPAASVFVLFAIFGITALASMQTGLHGDPRTTNPEPGDAPYPPFLGVTDWPPLSGVTLVVVTIGFFGVATWSSIRDRGPH